jgi:lipoprotein-releasing system permease protein
MNLLVEIAWVHVTSRIRQTSVAIGGVAVGVGFTILMAGLMQGSQKDFVRQLVDTMPHVTVSGERMSAARLAAEEKYAVVQSSNPVVAEKRTGIKDPRAVMSLLRSWVPGGIAPSTKTSAMLNFGSGRVGVTVMGIDPREEEGVSRLARQMRSGQLSDLYKASNGLIVGVALAKKFGARVGTNVIISAGEGLQISGTVVGTFSSGLREIDESQVYSLMRTAQVLAGNQSLVNEIRVHLKDALSAGDVANRIQQQTGYRAVAWQEANADLLSSFKIRDMIMYLVMGAMLLVSTFGIYSIISTIINEKRHDIAIMKSFGMKEGLVRSIFLTESAIIGGLGIVAGWVIGFLLCWAVSKITYTNPLNGETQAIYIYYSIVYYMAVAAIALISCTGAAYIPVLKATRVHPVDIIRGGA